MKPYVAKVENEVILFISGLKTVRCDKIVRVVVSRVAICAADSYDLESYHDGDINQTKMTTTTF